MENGFKKNCELGEEMISYLYGELDPSAGVLFEEHMSGCASCAVEFSGISTARSSVLDWKRDEFESLPTPRISVEPSSDRIEHSGGQSLWSALGDFLGLGGWRAALAAGLLIAVGAVAFWISSGTGPELQVASNTSVPPVSIPEKVPQQISITNQEPVLKDAGQTDARPLRTNAGVKGVPSVAGEHRKLQRSLPPYVRAQNSDGTPELRNARKPALSDFEDNDDRSLRLSDLFEEEVGASR